MVLAKHSEWFEVEIERPRKKACVQHFSSFLNRTWCDAILCNWTLNSIPILLIHFFSLCLWESGLHAEQKSICHLGLSYSLSPTRLPAIIVSQPLLAEKGSPEWQSIFFKQTCTRPYALKCAHTAPLEIRGGLWWPWLIKDRGIGGQGRWVRVSWLASFLTEH